MALDHLGYERVWLGAEVWRAGGVGGEGSKVLFSGRSFGPGDFIVFSLYCRRIFSFPAFSPAEAARLHANGNY